MQANAMAPLAERKEPETFCWTLSMRRSRSAWLLSKGIRRSSRKASTWSCPNHKRSKRFWAGVCLTAPTLPGAAWRRRVGGMVGGEECLVARNERRADSRREVAQTGGARLLGGRLHLQQ